MKSDAWPSKTCRYQEKNHLEAVYYVIFFLIQSCPKPIVYIDKKIHFKKIFYIDKITCGQLPRNCPPGRMK